MKQNKTLLLLFALAFIATGCVTKSKYLELDGKYKQCMSDLAFTDSEKIDFENKCKDLTAEVAGLKAQLESLKADSAAVGRRMRIMERNVDKTRADYDELLRSFSDQNASKNALLAEKEARLAEKEAKLSELQAILDQKDAEVKALKNKVANALKGFENMGLTIYEKNGKVYVSLDEKLLFASGSWDIDNRGKEALTELGKVLASDANINVVIEGHTDNVPYRGNSNVKDNWDLSVMRATAVVKELLKNDNINPQRISASGRSEYLPVDSHDSKEARAKNRRTEIILTPKLDELFQIIDNQ